MLSRVWKDSEGGGHTRQIARTTCYSRVRSSNYRSQSINLYCFWGKSLLTRRGAMKGCSLISRRKRGAAKAKVPLSPFLPKRRNKKKKPLKICLITHICLWVSNRNLWMVEWRDDFFRDGVGQHGMLIGVSQSWIITQKYFKSNITNGRNVHLEKESIRGVLAYTVLTQTWIFFSRLNLEANPN